MPLRFDDKWVWDFWFAQDGSDTHIFYLQADRALQDEHLRHWNVSIGHAVSRDLKTWQVLPDALRPSVADDVWDNKTTWTGSVIRHDNRWYLFYTGSKREEDGLIQRIGVATSPDLTTWHKHPNNPVLAADPTWYELLDRSQWHDQAWRDPYVVQAEDGVFHAFITARANIGPGDERGVIAHATSPDLINWTQHPPVTLPGEFGHMEVPQVLYIQGRFYLVFCCPYDNASQARQARTADAPQSGTFYLMADTLTGPYTWATEGVLHADAFSSLYSGKLIQGPDDRWYFMAFNNYTPQGDFIGTLADPIPVTIAADGRITLDEG